MEEVILNYVIRMAAIAVLAVIVWIGNKISGPLVKFIEAKLTAEQEAMLDKFIDELTASADQLYKAVDPDGDIRLQYVKDMLRKEGVQLTDAIMAKVEASVFKLPKTKTTQEGEDQ